MSIAYVLLKSKINRTNEKIESGKLFFATKSKPGKKKEIARAMGNLFDKK
ncbi:MAG TPA: hypothetical protein PLB59_04070 [Bacteroidales bacterium]|jgi:hypothetical protein|nr:hypothetical protein [Bacteroidales bacterium]OPZ95524.1 MAG: hypothetical protein BWY70_01982 [Bacteroidetes bacterium ADurb.Bin408]HPB24853.1 hypothetical protein [Bacteroidales bacterium]HPI29484.1 hypothetical protein [Bacteroidales bacterium]HQN15620.1 hypothetical protein [Bacteroidales bacterium]